MEFYLVLILTIIIFDYVLSMTVEWLNLKAIRPEVPSEFQEYYSADRYRLAQEYLKANTWLDLIRSTVLFPVIVLFLLLGGFSLTDRVARQWAEAWDFGEVGTGLVFGALLAVGSRLIHLPFSLYNVFVIEEKFGFNRMTWKTYLADLFKGMFLGGLIGGGLFALTIWFFVAAGSNAWLYAWLGLVALQVLLMFVAPAWIMPLFNRFEPLEEGALKNEIQEFARKQNFHLQGIFRMDGSKRSTKANAFFTGFGKYRRIVLFDTLIEKHTIPELVAVLAHEIGHYKLRHIFKTFALSTLTLGVMFFLASILIENPGLFAAFQMERTSVYASLIFVGILYSPISRVFSVFGSYLSRKHEFEADAYAARTYGHPQDLIEALKKLSVDSLSNLHPHPLKVFLEYSHPPVLDRVATLRRLAAS